jgi:N utilization substance protein B
MSKRRSGRELAFRLLFQMDQGGGAMDEVFAAAREASEATSEVWEFGAGLARGAWQNKSESDSTIRRLASGWTTERMASVDLNLLRLALYEIEKREDIPHSVSINEAVELAKDYSTPESARFINGILGNYVRAQKTAAPTEPDEAPAEEEEAPGASDSV